MLRERYKKDWRVGGKHQLGGNKMKTFGTLLFVCSVAWGSRLRRQNYDPASCAAYNNPPPYPPFQGNFAPNPDGNPAVLDPRFSTIGNGENGNNYQFRGAPNNNLQGQGLDYPVNQPKGGNGFIGNNNNVGPAGLLSQGNQNYYNGNSNGNTPPGFPNGQGYSSAQNLAQGSINGAGYNQAGLQGGVNGPLVRQVGGQGPINGPGYNIAPPPPQGFINNASPGFIPAQGTINNGAGFNPGQFQGPANGQAFRPSPQQQVEGFNNGGRFPSPLSQGPLNNGNDFGGNRQSGGGDNLIGFSSGGRGVYYLPNFQRNPNQNPGSNFDNSNNNADSFFRPQVEDPFIISSYNGGR